MRAEPTEEWVLTNDDGIDAPGLAALREAVAGLARARVIAPHGPQSGCGHAVTTHRPFRVGRRADGSLSVEGTPADCARLAVFAEAPTAAWIVSGINAGGNLGADVFHSGTVAAAREAALRGRSGIAISQYIVKGCAIDWERAAAETRRVLARLTAAPCPPGTFWNVNLPHLAGDDPDPALVICPLEVGPLPLDYRHDGEFWTYAGVYQDRPRADGSDVDTCFRGQIAATLVPVFGRAAPSRPGWS
jgi:5'-nucleotidase